ncbi:HAMP domain-containing sensor histidine kinase [Brevundimonas sp.]|uniref:HAMP domain-containing sensor histidine kinase n=1 Tax=Brevundimonas sp. TaxID=1871086 RepID=UPI002FCAA957
MNASLKPPVNAQPLNRTDPAQTHRRALWHLLWGFALLALCATALFTRASLFSLIGLFVAALPALAVFGLPTLAPPRTPWPQPVPPAPLWTVILWGLCPVIALGLTGGLNGPLAALAFAPVAGGLALRTAGSERSLVYGLGAALLGLFIGALAHPLLPQASTSPFLSNLLGILVLVFAVVAALNTRSTGPVVPLAMARMESALSDQPGLTLVLSPNGKALAAYGAAPPAIDVDGLFSETDSEGGLIEAVHPPDRPTVRAALSRAQAGQPVQVRFTPRAALDRRVLLVVRRMQGDSRRIAALMLDATLQHARESELDAARSEAEAQAQARARFIAHLSHELRTPLNAVLGFSDMMKHQLFGPLSDRYLGYAASIHTAGSHLLDVIGNVLDVSRIDADRYELDCEDTDARDLADAALALVRVQAEEKSIDLSAELPDHALDVNVDRRAVKQILVNLLGNAVKFTPANGKVTLSAARDADTLVMKISDNGVGIAPQDLARLGRPFEQAGDARQKAQGTGLGLSLARSLAELHGGTLTLESQIGEGTTATLRLPAL